MPQVSIDPDTLPTRKRAPWTPRDAILGLLGIGKTYAPEVICRMTGLLPEQLAAALCEMEMSGEVERFGGGWRKVPG